MKIVMTVCTRDEADIVDAHLSFHLNAGVDLVIVTDTGSTDGTLELIEPYRRAGLVDLRQDAGVFRQGRLQTAMARSAVEDHGADWVLNSDADEFWIPRGRSYGLVLDAIPVRYGVVRGLWRQFVARPDDGRLFWERMTYRLAAVHPVHDPTSRFRPNVKIAHRGSRDVRVGGGGHDVLGHPLALLRGWYPIEVLHFPVRSPAQLTRKWRRALDHVGPERAGYIRRSALADETSSEFRDLAVADDVLGRGLDEGIFVEDTRVRDALRPFARAGGEFHAASDPRVEFPTPTVLDDAQFAAEIAALGEADLVRVQRSVDTLERRVGQLERHPALRLSTGLRSLGRRVKSRI